MRIRFECGVTFGDYTSAYISGCHGPTALTFAPRPDEAIDMFILRALFRLVLVLAVLLIIGVVVLGREQLLATLFGPVTYTPIDFATLQRTPRPNQYLMCPADLCAASIDAASPVYDVSDAALKKTWLALMSTQPRTVQVGLSPDASQYDFIQRSKWFRFPDTITVKFIPLPEGRSTLAIYSRSRYGRSDFGVNQQRIEAWLKRLDQRLTARAG